MSDAEELFEAGADPVGAARIRRCRPDETSEIHVAILAGAEAYRGVIPEDCWHEPYMTRADLLQEIEAGVVFWGDYREGYPVGVMGLQDIGASVSLIRHAYVHPEWQRKGVGGALLTHLVARATRPMLIGTWKAASWATRFYEKNGFLRVAESETLAVLDRYWTVPLRQAEASVVLADKGWFRREGVATASPQT